MKAIRLVQVGRPLETMSVPVPSVGPGEVLVQVRAAGVCHSDAHYRGGRSRVDPLPLTLGHEVAGVVAETGREVEGLRSGDRVCVHYLATCGTCGYCRAGQEQFCPQGKMIGKYRDGGFAEYLVMPARSLFHLPAEVPFECGAVMMCSSATAYHALRKARLTAGETVAVFGVGGLGMSAVQLACALGAREVFAVDLNAAKLELARQFGAVPVAVRDGDPVEQLLALTHGRGVDVSVELVGLPATMRQAVLCLAIQGRAALAGITQESFAIAPYQEVLNKEAEIIGVSDHLASELPGLIRMVQEGRLKLDHVVSRRLPLEAKAINEALDALEQQTDVIRSVVVPTSLDAP